MRLIRSIEEQAKVSESWRRRGSVIGFVPTMGALHRGHMSLVDASLAVADRTIVSVFVNPRQFGPKEDYSRYPRTFAGDRRMLARAGVDALFAPGARSMYPKEFATRVEVTGQLSRGLCGPRRPGHFSGVTTVVAKLLNAVRPDLLFLGQKDAQQAAIIGRLILDLNLGVKVKVLPTVREPDGLALSSRNRYLSVGQRKVAPLLYRALRSGRDAIREGVLSAASVRARMRRMLAAGRGLRIQYLDIVDARTLQPVSRIRGRVLLAAAVLLGATRLIDNLPARAPRR